MTIQEYQKKYGTETVSLLVGRFILLSPDFVGDRELAREIGRAMGDLEVVLKSLPIEKE